MIWQWALAPHRVSVYPVDGCLLQREQYGFYFNNLIWVMEGRLLKVERTCSITFEKCLPPLWHPSSLKTAPHTFVQVGNKRNIPANDVTLSHWSTGGGNATRNTSMCQQRQWNKQVNIDAETTAATEPSTSDYTLCFGRSSFVGLNTHKNDLVFSPVHYSKCLFNRLPNTNNTEQTQKEQMKRTCYLSFQIQKNLSSWYIYELTT